MSASSKISAGTPKISVIVPLYNKEKAIKSTLLSILGQNCSVDFEVVVVDDGSTDRSSEIVCEMAAKDCRIVYFYKENGGVSSARNTGTQLAKGEWLCYFDADDLMEPDGLETLYKMTTRIPGTVFSHANFYQLDKNGNKRLALPLMRERVCKNGFKMWCLREGFPRQGAYLLKRELALGHLSDERISRYEDIKHMFDIFRTGVSIVTTGVPVMTYCTNFSSLSRANDYKRDFLSQLDFRGKSFWEKVALGGLYRSALESYGDVVKNEGTKNAALWGYVHKFLFFIVCVISRGMRYCLIFLKKSGGRLIDKTRCLKWNFSGKNIHIHRTARVGAGTYFEGINRICAGTWFRGEIGIGSYIGHNCNVSAKIGRFSSVGPNCETISGRHAYTYPYATTCPMFFSTAKQSGATFVSGQKFKEYRYAVPDKQYAAVVGNDCWIGANVKIIAGVKIGDGAVVLAGAVVSKDIPAYAIAGGVPAKVVKYRYKEEDIEFLKKTKWWDWSPERLREHADLFCDIEKLKAFLL